MWAEAFLALVGCGAIIGSVFLVNSYPWPVGILKQYYGAQGLEVPEGAFISHGFAIPVLILIAVGILMTILTTRTRFGRYVFAIGGNPEAAELGGINTRKTIMLVFALMGALCGLAACISTARLNAKMLVRIAYSVVARDLLVMAIRKARKAPVPRPPVKLSRALAE